MSHTEGPWYVSEFSELYGYRVESDARMWVIANVAAESDDESDNKANARLVAAAPSLLDAAERYLYERDLYNVPPRQQEKDAEVDLRKAIAKARGEEER